MENFNIATIVSLIVFVICLYFALKKSKKGIKTCNGCNDTNCSTCTKVNDLTIMLKEAKLKQEEEIEKYGIREEYEKQFGKNEL